MPYTVQPARIPVDAQLSHLDIDNWNSGDLAYAIFRIMDIFGGREDESFARRALTSGVVDEARAEWRRRRIVDYEINKITQNGDIPLPPPRVPLSDLVAMVDDADILETEES